MSEKKLKDRVVIKGAEISVDHALRAWREIEENGQASICPIISENLIPSNKCFHCTDLFPRAYAKYLRAGSISRAHTYPCPCKLLKYNLISLKELEEVIERVIKKI